MQNETLLSHQILKAKNFKTLSPERAIGSRRDSYLWRGLLAGKVLVDEGYMWRVGNGKKIHIWQDRWLVDAPNLRPEVPYTSFAIPIKVANLIDSISREWIMDDDRTWFNADDIKRIEQIHLPRRPCDDCKVWLGSEDEILTVHSAYHMARQASVSSNRGTAASVI